MPKLFLLLLACVSASLAQSVPIFDDVPSYQGYYNHANMMRLRFITMGCTYVPSKYCPNDYLTRGQAAVMIIRSIYSAKTGNPEGFSYNPNLPQYFSDVPKSYPQPHPQYVYIQKMAELGITSGCQSGMFCPDDPINYAQLATFAIRARMIRDTNSIFALDCNAAPGTFANYPCSPSFPDVPSTEFFFPYVQKVNQLIGWQQSMAHDCWVGGFCPYSNVVRGRFAFYAVSVIMNATSPSLQPNGGNLPSVQAPYNYAAGITMSCEPAAGNLYTWNQFVAVDANNVYALAGSNFGTPPQWPSLWITYLWRQILGPYPPQPATMDSRLGNAASVTLQSANFGVPAGQTYTQSTKHGVFSGCVAPPPAGYPYIASTRTETVAQTTQTITSSPVGADMIVDMVACTAPCNRNWFSGTQHDITAPSQIFVGGGLSQFTGWSNGVTSAYQKYTVPATNSTLTANYSSPTVTMIITAAPAGLAVIVDGQSCSTPCAKQWSAGSTHTVGVNSPQTLAGSSYSFVSWSDGGATSHSITAAATTLTAAFTAQTLYSLTASASPPGAGAVAPSSGQYAPGTVVTLTAAAAAGYTIQSWSGVDSWNGTTGTATVTMNAARNVVANFTSTNFFITASPTTQTVGPPGSAQFAVALNGSPSSTTAFVASGLPAGASATFSPPNLSGSGTTNLTILTASNTPLGRFAITVTATSGSASYSTLLFLDVVTPSPATMISPTPNGILAGGPATFTWTPGAGVSQYQLKLGSTPGAADFYSANTGANQSTVANLPSAGQPVTMYATLESMVSGNWQSRLYTYTVDSATAPAPTNLATNSGLSGCTQEQNPWVYNDNQERSYCYTLEGPPGADARRITGCTVRNPNGSPALQAQANPVATSQTEVIITYSATIKQFTGLYAATCSYNGGPGNTSDVVVQNGLRVYDASPVIERVDPYPPNPDGSFYVALYGRSFGSSRDKLLVCTSDTLPCTESTEVEVKLTQAEGAVYGYWDSQQINALLVPLTPAAYGRTYWLRVRSKGYGFSAFVFAPQDPPTANISNAVPVMSQAPPPSVKMTRGSGTNSIAGTMLAVTVGQLIDLHATVQNLPAGVAITSQSWTIPGNTVAGYTRSVNTAQVTAFNGSTTGDARFYWVEGSRGPTGQTSETRTVTYTAVLSNGAALSGSAQFLVHRPIITLRITSRTATPVIDMRTLNEKPGLQFGDNSDSGVRFMAQGEIIGEDGELAITQLLKTTRTYVTGGITRTRTSGELFLLDRNPEYNGSSDAPGGTSFIETAFGGDAPFLEVTAEDSRVTVSENGKTYFMYKPNGDGSIWVALQMAEWSWTATATNNGGTWSVDTGAFTPPPPQNSVNATLVNSGQQLPQWPQNVDNLQYQ